MIIETIRKALLDLHFFSELVYHIKVLLNILKGKIVWHLAHVDLKIMGLQGKMLNITILKEHYKQIIAHVQYITL